MNKLLLILAIAFAPMAAFAGGPNGPGEPVFNGFSGFAWYLGTGTGKVHERWACDSNWENCPGHWIWYPTYKWPYGPDECDGEILGPGEIGDLGDGSDILVPGEYYACALDGNIFRDKSDY